MPWAITFTNTFAAANVGTPLGRPLHPTQLYEAGAEALIMVVLLVTERKGRPFAGRTFWLYMLLYAISRYVIEIYRGDERGSVAVLSTSQFISVLLAPLAIGMLVYLSQRVKPTLPPKRALLRPGTKSRLARCDRQLIPANPAPFMPSHMVIVPDDSNGARLDRFLVSVVPGQSRSQIQRLIKKGHIRIDGREARPNQTVGPEQITIDVPGPASPEPQPRHCRCPSCSRDPDIVVVDKPAGMVVHPAAGHATGTLVNALLHHVTDLSGIGGERRPGIVHRLDRGTSGLMVVAKHDAAHEELARQFPRSRG